MPSHFEVLFSCVVLAVAMLAILKNIRVPDGVVAFYPVTNLTKTVLSSPSRMMFFHDVFVPIHFMFLCLESYSPPLEHVNPTNFLMSPVFAPDWVLNKLPNFVYLISGAYDPLLDDAVNISRRLKKIFKNHYHHIYYLPHGFLNLALPQIPEAVRAKSDSIKYLKNIFDAK
jgi:acetyl esterase/lipase